MTRPSPRFSLRAPTTLLPLLRALVDGKLILQWYWLVLGSSNHQITHCATTQVLLAEHIPNHAGRRMESPEAQEETAEHLKSFEKIRSHQE